MTDGQRMRNTIMAGNGSPEQSPGASAAMQERAQKTRIKLIEAAIRLLATQGYAATTMAKVARAANVSSGPRQYHFPRPADLFLAVISHIQARQVSQLAEPGATEQGVARLAAQFQALLIHAGSQDHVAMLELKMAMRGDPALQAAIGPKIRAFEERADLNFLTAFRHGGLGDQQLIALRAMMAATLRGIAIAGFERDQTDIKSEIGQMLPRMLGSLLQD
jgi:AcrR family transcriptional regulator